jgi:hypothetical protein
MMLTRKQIERMSAKNKISLYAQERDYVQAAFLSQLFMRTKGLVFKGGTCLKIAYGSHRFSEDLDFNSKIEGTQAIEAIRAAADRMRYFGIEAVLRDWRGGASGFCITLSYKGPLYDGRDGTKGSVRIDVSLRGEDVGEAPLLVDTGYDDVGSAMLIASKLEDIMAEKIRALLVRGTARDLYDMMFIAAKGVKVDRELVNRKLSIYGMEYSQGQAASQIASLEGRWAMELEPLLAEVVPYEAAAKAVTGWLAGL